jgi:tetratricopeptide (TPR) repeat protein
VAKTQQRRYASRKTRTSPYYYQQKVTFTRQARVLGSISIVAIILTVVVTTVFLTRYNAQFDFQKGLANYQNNRYSSAYFNLKESISPLNPYLAAAHLLMAEICFTQQKDLSLTRNHIIKGYQADPSDSINARLLYLEGKLDKQQGDNIAAYQRFKEAIDYLPKFDSATYQLAELDLFVFDRFDQALVHFQTLAEHNPHNHEAVLASAYCHQKLGQHEMAITQIDRYMDMQQSVGMAYYIKAISAQALGFKDISCQNYIEANHLGIPAAQDSLNSYCGMSFVR